MIKDLHHLYVAPRLNEVLVYFGTCVVDVFIHGTLLPWQRILKRVTQVEQAPCDDNIVVKRHIKTDLEEKKH